MKVTRLPSVYKNSFLTRLTLFAAALMCSWSAVAASTTVVISQLYGAGGNSGALYQNDYVELFNKSASSVSLNGWSVQYASSTGAFSAVAALPNVTLQPGQYFLLQLAGSTSNGSPLPVAGDATNTSVNLSGTAGKVALANQATALGTVSSLPDSRIVDLVGFGTTANLSEGGTTAPAPSTTLADFRANSGCTDTDNNGTDFSTAAPAPRNMASAFNSCGGGGPTGYVRVETKADGTGVVVPVQNVVAGTSITVYAIARDVNSNFVSNIAADSWTLINKTGRTAAGDLVPSGDLKSAVFTGHGAGNATIHVSSGTLADVDSGTITVSSTTPTQVRVESAADGSGTVLSNQTVFSGHSTTMYAIRRDVYTNFVDNVAASSWSLSTKSGAVQDADLVASADLKSATFTGNGEGTATVHATSGALTAVDSGVLTVASLPQASVVVSQLYGGGGNSGAAYQNDFVELFNRTANPVSLNGWSVQYASSTGAFNNVVALPNVNIAAHSYYLISLNTNGITGSPLPTPDLTATNINMSASAGKIALANISTALGTITWPDLRVIDLVAYGASSPYEGAGAAPQLSSSTSALRNSDGCTDTDNNSADFTAAIPSARNSASPQNICSSQTPPTISSIPNQAVDSAQAVGPISFDVDDDQTSPANLTVTATSSNPTLLPNNQITLGGSDVVRNITLHPVSGQTGSTLVTVTVTDGDSMTASTSFYLFVGTGPQFGIIFSENFDEYSDGTSLSFANNSPWYHFSGTNYELMVSNNAAQLNLYPTNSEDIYADFAGGPFAVTSGYNLYMGFTLNQTSLPGTNGDYVIHFRDTADNSSTNFAAKVFVSTGNAANGKFRLGISNRANSPANVQFPMDLDLNTAYNVVVRYEVGTATATIWVNPTSPNAPGATATDVATPFDVGSIGLREPGTPNTPGTTGSQVIDNIVVSTSMSDVTTFPVLPPSITAARSGNTLTLTWPTNNNSGYVLQTASTVNATTWNSVNGVSVNTTNYSVTIPFTATPAYFRLKQ